MYENCAKGKFMINYIKLSSINKNVQIYKNNTNINFKKFHNKINCDSFIKSGKAVSFGNIDFKQNGLEPIDISLLGGPTQDITVSFGPRKTTAFRIDMDNTDAIPIQGINGPIWNAYSDVDLRFALREMEFNDGKLSDKFKSNYCNRNRRTDAGKEEYIEALIQKTHNNLAAQKEQLKELLPSTDDCILYRGVELCDDDDKNGSFNYRYDFANMLRGLRKR